MSQQARLQSGKLWLAKYSRKNTIRSYRNWYGISKVCAILELRIIGLQIDDKRLEQEKEEQNLYADSDDNFSFIAGYTSGGAPYGITGEDMEHVEEKTEV